MNLPLVPFQKDTSIEYHKHFTFPSTRQLWDYPKYHQYHPMKATAYKIGISVPIVFVLLAEFLRNLAQFTIGNVIAFGKNGYRNITKTCKNIISPQKPSFLPKNIPLHFSWITYLSLAWLLYEITTICLPKTLWGGINEIKDNMSQWAIGSFYCTAGGFLFTTFLVYALGTFCHHILHLRNFSWTRISDSSTQVGRLFIWSMGNLSQGSGAFLASSSFFLSKLIQINFSEDKGTLSKGMTYAAEIVLAYKLCCWLAPSIQSYLFSEK